MEKEYLQSNHPLSKAVEIKGEGIEFCREFPFEIFNVAENENKFLKDFFDKGDIYLQFYKDGKTYQYQRVENYTNTQRYPFVIRNIEKFQFLVEEFYATVYNLSEERRNWFEGSKYGNAKYFFDIFFSAIPEDFLFPDQFIKKWINLLQSQEFQGFKKSYGFGNEKSLSVSHRLSNTGMEAPDEFLFEIKKDGVEVDLPLVRFGKTSEKEVTIFSIQDEAIHGLPEGLAKQFNTEVFIQKFADFCTLVDSFKSNVPPEEFQKQFCNYDEYSSKFEWFLKFWNQYLETYKEMDRKYPLLENSLLDWSKAFRILSQAKVSESLFEERRKKRQELNIYMKGFLRGYGSVPVSHTISIISSIFLFAECGLEHIVVPAHYPLREKSVGYFQEGDPKKFMDEKMFKQVAGMIRAVCDHIPGLTLESEPDLESSFRIKIEKEKLKCEKYAFIQELIDTIVKK